MKDKQRAAEEAYVVATFEHHDLLFDVWKDLAIKHRRLRSEAETENKHLRGLYANQVHTLETLRSLLQMQERVQNTLRFTTRYYVCSSFDADDSAIVAMERLYGDLGQLYADTERVLLSKGLHTEIVTAPRSIANAVADCFWHEMTRHYVENEVERGQSQRDAKVSTISQALTMELEDDGVLVRIQSRYAGKRIIDRHRQVVVLSGRSQLLEAFGIAVNDVNFQEKYWLVMSEATPGVTIVNVCISMYRYVHFDCEMPNRQQFVDRTCQMLTKQKQLGFEPVLQRVEQSFLSGYPS
ncbi:hypothetical protein GN244_ATG09734 [Phytophthora infestans]|uniref:Uncharacterized protein n=1 Tax=Phytophthora infestans TaxID=4787 RepID=A0A833W1B3_PHYIN|nr:hypothetical protein GN244_ATG09734 [Phytophthora infestans]